VLTQFLFVCWIGLVQGVTQFLVYIACLRSIYPKSNHNQALNLHSRALVKVTCTHWSTDTSRQIHVIHISMTS